MLILQLLILEITYVKNTCINSIYTLDTQIKCASIKNAYTKSIYIKSAFLGNIKLKILIRLKITLIGLGVNNCYF